MSTEKKIWVLVLFFAGLFSYAVYNVYRPDTGPMSFVRGEVRVFNENVIVGPYPTEKEMIRLKKRGVVEVISLMDDDSTVESVLVGEEKKLAAVVGLRFANFPMDFARLDSDDNKVHLADAVAYVLSLYTDKKMVYVHCYLGRHRVGSFEREFGKALSISGSSGISGASQSLSR